MDKKPAAPTAIKELIAAKKLPEDLKLRQIQYLNHMVAQDHRAIKRYPINWIKFFLSLYETTLP